MQHSFYTYPEKFRTTPQTDEMGQNFSGGLYVVGGQQRTPRSVLQNDQQWYDYGKGLILAVDATTGAVQTRLDYRSPAAATAEGVPILFKSATRTQDRLYATTQTEVITYALPAFEQIGWISLPQFNDVHHVQLLPNGNLLVANTGLDMVLEVTPGGDVVREWNVLSEAPWARFSKAIDYRKGISTKPHRAHPNYVFYLNDETDVALWATRFECKDAICLTDPTRRIAIDIERVHDGLLYRGHLYFTTVNAHLVIVNAATLCIEDQIDLNQFHPADVLLGWCRGVWVDGDRVWVGFSRIRATKFREALSWVRVGFQRALSTRIACYDLKTREHIKDIDLEPYGLNAVFSILPGDN